MWGCHFLILSSNALWRKFVKLDQGRLKLVYKGVSEGRRRRNVVHLRRLRCLQSARLGGTAFFPSSLLQSCSKRCKMPCFLTLRSWKGWEGRRGGGGGGWYERGNASRRRKQLLFLLSKPERGQGLFPPGDVFTNRLLTVWAPQSKVAFVHLLRLAWDAQCPGAAFILSKHRCSTIVSMQRSAIYWGTARCHFHTLTRS